jgi:8-oxo-dGTP diphosphatase
VTPSVVVAAAVIEEARLLAARRTAPPEAAGRWELPGGKVEAGEQPDRALIREIREELGCGITVEHWLPGSPPIGTTGLVLRVAACRLTEGRPEPGIDHDSLLWLRSEQLDDVDWLEPDRPFLPSLRELLLG